MSWLDDLSTRVLARTRPGRALAAIARASVPIVGAERFALRDPETGVEQANQPVF